MKSNALLAYALPELERVSDFEALLELTKIGLVLIKTSEALEQKVSAIPLRKRKDFLRDSPIIAFRAIANKGIPFVLSVHAYIAYMLAFRNDEPSSLDDAVAEYYLELAEELHKKYFLSGIIAV